MCVVRGYLDRVCVKWSVKRSSNEVSHEGVNGKVGRERERERASTGKMPESLFVISSQGTSIIQDSGYR